MNEKYDFNGIDNPFSDPFAQIEESLFMQLNYEVFIGLVLIGLIFLPQIVRVARFFIRSENQ